MRQIVHIKVQSDWISLFNQRHKKNNPKAEESKQKNKSVLLNQSLVRQPYFAGSCLEAEQEHSPFDLSLGLLLLLFHQLQL